MTSGVRLGTPAATTRGLNEEDFVQVGNFIAKIVREGEAAVPAVRAGVAKNYGEVSHVSGVLKYDKKGRVSASFFAKKIIPSIFSRNY